DDDGYYTYILDNTCDRRLIFSYFHVKPTEYEYSIIRDLPEDILVLEPGKSGTYFICKEETGRPGAGWIANFMDYPTGSVDDPTKNRDYVFHYAYSADEDNSTYTYYLKNISEKKIRFYDFIIEGEEEYYTFKEIPEGSVYTEPGENISVFSFFISSDGNTPSLNWYADFGDNSSSTEAPSEDEMIRLGFCEGVTKLIDAASESFDPVKGNMMFVPGPDNMFEEYYCFVDIEGVKQEKIEYLILFWDFTGYIGSPGSQSEIEQRFEEYRLKLRECLPESMKESIIEPEEDDQFTKRVEYEGKIKGETHFVELSASQQYTSDDYELELYIEEIY
ncbi:MAG: hypothetical protein K8R53_03325, partial [Bacteroidales bacterium]|nr:hypothetical protein [Bacteroidales bacterium]